MKNLLIWLMIFSIFATSSVWAGGSYRIKYRQVSDTPVDTKANSDWEDGTIKVKDGFILVYDSSGKLIAQVNNSNGKDEYLQSSESETWGFGSFVFGMAFLFTGAYFIYDGTKKIGMRENDLQACLDEGSSREHCETLYPDPWDDALIAYSLGGVCLMAGFLFIQDAGLDNEKHHYISLPGSVSATQPGRLDILFKSRTYNAFNKSLLSDLSNKRKNRLSFGIHPSPGQVVAKARIRF